MHHKEYAKSSNTPCLLQWLGPAAHILVHGVEEHEKRLDALIARSGSRALVLFPGESSVDVSDVLARDEGARAGEDGQVGPAVDGWTVVVVDGSWRQARKMERRLPAHLQRVHLSPGVGADGRCCWPVISTLVPPLDQSVRDLSLSLRCSV